MGVIAAGSIGSMLLRAGIEDWFRHAPSILMGFYILIIVFNIVPYLTMRFVLL